MMLSQSPTHHEKTLLDSTPPGSPRSAPPVSNSCHSTMRLAAFVAFSLGILLAGYGSRSNFYNGGYALVSRKGGRDALPRPEKTYSILPRKIYSVVGLESSGTKFVSKILQDALDSGPYRKGSHPCKAICIDGEDAPRCKKMKRSIEGHECRETNEVMVQHFSLPEGSTCHESPDPPIVDVVLPPQCTRDHDDDQIAAQECNAMASELWGVRLDGRAMEYPKRYLLDIVKNKEWYDRQGVEQVFVIVVRDEKISFAARHNHCNDVDLRRREEEAGTRIIDDAIHRYILSTGKGKTANNETSIERLWAAEEYQHDRHGRHLGALPSGNGLVVVSYESLVKLSGTYVQMLYAALGIDSDHVPDVRNSNEKYLNTTFAT